MNNNRIDDIINFRTGDTLRFTAEFKSDDQLVSPTQIIVKIKNPNNSIIIIKKTPTDLDDPKKDTNDKIYRESIGKYFLNKKINLPGEWWIRWEGKGRYNGVIEEKFRVIPSNVTG